MGLFYRWRQPAPADWVAGKATIRESQPQGEQWSRETGDSVFDWELNHFGFRTHTFVLDVVAPVHGSYELSGEFKVPRRAENVGWLAPSAGIGLKPGLELPVHVDPRDREALRIDWQGLPRRPGAQAGSEGGGRGGPHAPGRRAGRAEGAQGNGSDGRGGRLSARR